MKNSFNRLCGILVLLICALGLPSLLHAQDSADDLRATQIRSEISKRNGTGKYGEIASLLKELIGLGKRDSETYYKTALALALSDNRSQGRLFISTQQSQEAGLPPPMEVWRTHCLD